jgi:hypothetical protein
MRCASEPELAFEGKALQQIRRFYPVLSSRQACVMGSGDNYLAFALAGLGAQVTSVDISERQLEVADGRARALGLDLEFVRADAADLTALRIYSVSVSVTSAISRTSSTEPSPPLSTSSSIGWSLPGHLR